MICLRTTTKHTETASGKSRQLQLYERPGPIFIPTRCKQSWSVMHECFVIPSAVWISAIFTFTSPRSALPVNEEGKSGAVKSSRIYTGRVISLDLDTVRFPDGSTGELEMIRHPGASAIVPCASDPHGGDPAVLMLRQFRYAAGGPLWEIPAGTLAPGESPEACARRELLEEAGVTAERLERLTSIYTTPGFTDEVIHLFMASQLT